MDKTRIVKFLDSLEERGLMTANQQSILLRPKDGDVLAAGTNAGCVNENPASCSGSGDTNSKCTNIGNACANSMNYTCINSPGGTVNTNMSTSSCGG